VGAGDSLLHHNLAWQPFFAAHPSAPMQFYCTHFLQVVGGKYHY